MKVSYNITMLASGVVIPVAFEFLQTSLLLMVPWFITMFFVVLADLAAGIWKSYKLKVKVHASRAFRETMGKLIVYFAFVCMVCCVNVAAKEEFDWAKWASMVVILLEFGSIVGNILKPHGIDISMNALFKALDGIGSVLMEGVGQNDRIHIVFDKLVKVTVERDAQFFRKLFLRQFLFFTVSPDVFPDLHTHAPFHAYCKGYPFVIVAATD